MRNVVTLVLGGGRGTRLYPLTKYRAKPAVPLATKYRLIDIPISNCINSNLNRVYVLTPRGQVLDMSAGSTVLDFAYQVHTEVGHRCRGAKVNGRIVPLTHVVNTGDRVEIITAKRGGPSRDWLRAELDAYRSVRDGAAPGKTEPLP